MWKTFCKVILAIALTAVAYFFSTGIHDFWFLAWFAPLPTLFFALYERKKWLVFIVAALGYFFGSMNVLYYFQTLMPIHTIITIFFDVLQGAVLFGAIVLLARFLIRKRATWWTMLFFPSAWVLFEFLSSALSVNGTIGNMAYSQLKFLPLVQLSSITGIWGVSFVLALFPSALAVIWYLRKNVRQFLLSMLFLLLVVGLALGFGVWRLQHLDKPVNMVKVGLLAIPTTKNELLTTQPNVASAVVKRYAQEIPRLKEQGAEIIVMPEKMVGTEPKSNADILKLFEESALANQEVLVFGLNQKFLNKRLNTAFVVSKAGFIIARYHKQHLLVGPESGYKAGKELAVIAEHGSTFGVAICKDMDFINPALRYARKGVGILLGPSLDFVIDKWAHSKPAIMGGVSGGYSVVRVGQWGLLLVSDKYGHILAQKSTSNSEVTAMVVDVPVYTGKTFYSICGNWLAWLLLGLFVALMASIVMD